MSTRQINVEFKALGFLSNFDSTDTVTLVVKGWEEDCKIQQWYEYKTQAETIWEVRSLLSLLAKIFMTAYMLS